MPQLKKVVLGLGNQLIYADTYEEGLARLGGMEIPAATTRETTREQKLTNEPGVPSATLQSVRDHLKKFRELQGQGRWSDAGKELEAIEAELKK
jgi:uncharacterized membrane protein (UPF0182 family)